MAGLADRPGSEETVKTTAAPEIEHYFTRLQ
jgi:hypothetical protein